MCKTKEQSAERQNENFRVYMMLPLLPGFEGQVGAAGGSALVTVLHWTYLSLSRGPNSLIENLKKKGIVLVLLLEFPDPFQYLHIGALRTCEELCGRLLTELVYIHSKLIIVDDTQCLIGSANINDRSQVGYRDSEAALFFEDCEFEDSKMNGKPYRAGKFASGLRKHLMKEHLGLLEDQQKEPKGIDGHCLDIDVTDCACDTFFDTWHDVANKNTELFEKVFRVYPTDLVSSFEQLAAWEGQIPMAEYNKAQAEAELDGLRGTLVNFPLYFLKDSNLAPGITTKEGLVPTAVFT
uniref:phospholipase D n=1 Tax=Plectus sambesii TaxID=2011161 RepID=A0A914X6B5_9BILA